MEKMDHGILQRQDATELNDSSGLQFGQRRNGIMGVPITFFDKFNPEQFEIIGLAAGNIRGLSGMQSLTGKDGPYINGTLKYGRVFISYKEHFL